MNVLKMNIKYLLFQDHHQSSAAVSLSGFGDKFLFYGFLPKTENELNKSLKNLK